MYIRTILTLSLVHEVQKMYIFLLLSGLSHRWTREENRRRPDPGRWQGRLAPASNA